MQDVKKGHWLVAGEVAFSFEGGDTLTGMRLNAIVRTDNDSKLIDFALIAQAQQVLQANHARRMEQMGVKYEVMDTVVTTLQYCGFMTAERFQRKPAAVAVMQSAGLQ